MLSSVVFREQVKNPGAVYVARLRQSDGKWLIGVLVSEAPSLAVVITNHNKGLLVRNAVQSVAAQLDSSDQLVLFDDASDDNSTRAVFNEVQGASFFSVFGKSKVRLGAAGSKNSAIALAGRPYIALLDADDILLPGAVSKIKAAFWEEKQASIVFGDYVEFKEGSSEAELVSVAGLADSNGWLQPTRLALNWQLLGSSPFTQALFTEIGGFDVRNPVTDDVDFFRRAFLAGHRATYIAYPIYQWNRSSSGNNASATDRLVARSWVRNVRFYWRFMPKRTFVSRLAQQCLTLIIGTRIEIDPLYMKVFRGRP